MIQLSCEDTLSGSYLFSNDLKYPTNLHTTCLLGGEKSMASVTFFSLSGLIFELQEHSSSFCTLFLEKTFSIFFWILEVPHEGLLRVTNQ